MIKAIQRHIIDKFQIRLVQFLIVVPASIFVIIGCEKEVSRSPVEPDPSQGVINISSSPKGATIFQNGRNTGRLTPDSLTFLNPDVYEVTLKLQYFKDTSLTVQLDKDSRREISIDYFSNPSMYGNLILFSLPVGASIFLNDSSLNRVTPDTIYGLLPGLYKATFKLYNHRDTEINALVESSITRNFSVPLRDTSVWVDFQTFNSGIQSNLLTAIAVDLNRIKWIGSSDVGLIKFDENNFSNFNTSNSGIPSNQINCLSVSNSNDLWIGTPSGLAIFNGSTWNIFNTSNSELPNNEVNAIKFDQNGKAWIGTNNGFANFDGINWQVFNYSSANFEYLWVTDLTVDINNTIWLGSNNFGILSWRNNIFTEYIDSLNNLPTGRISAAEVDLNNDPWFGHLSNGTSRGGISFYNGNIFTSFFPGSPSIKINSIHIEDLTNSKWVSTTEGVFRYDENNTVVNYNIQNTLLSSNNIKGIAKQESTLWIVTFGGGLNKFKME
ncbi:MAG: PEGA domain-containing protein [Ignavibacteriaceae bacterium]